jgi:hypothetical protein
VLVISEQFLVPPSSVKGGSMSFGGSLQLLGFCTFEACVGIFWPSIMKMRSQYIPEEARSTIMNFFRIPLNLFVCVVLYNVRSSLLVRLLLVCLIPQARVAQKFQHSSNTSVVSTVFAGECVPYHHHVWNVFYFPLHGGNLAETADGCF